MKKNKLPILGGEDIKSAEEKIKKFLKISLVSCKSDFIFTIYDDRGCDIVFADKGKMREYFPKLQKYLLEYDMEEMKKRIGE